MLTLALLLYVREKHYTHTHTHNVTTFSSDEPSLSEMRQRQWNMAYCGGPSVALRVNLRRGYCAISELIFSHPALTGSTGEV